ncbi:hypothetical protein [Pukyongiella litopenaei]|uniref:Uncharacterized protein n=1 Tax=Pukyongiella litopenaei TaxID=2605946 RepID=A0A5C2H3C7_9RHOB|nr:hypothetical protein [Pukyongiella litopenaei]QEP30396.1 hypothetical protein C6Y53_19435 [Pukyongiella litopenaei]
MTRRSGVSQPRPGRRASFPDNLPDPGPAAAIAIAARRFEITLAGRPATMDLTRLPGRASLARSFTQALWQACQVGGPAGTVRTAMSLAEAIHRFWRYLDATGSPVQALAGLDVSTIEGFDTWMAESGLHPNNRLHLMGDVVSLLRLADAGEPGGLSEESSRRLLYVSTRPGVPARPRDAYSDNIRAALKAAARADVAAIGQRFRPTLAQECETRIDRLERDAFAEIDRVGFITVKNDLFRQLYGARNYAGISNEGLSDRMHGTRHLLLGDLIALFVLLSLETGLEIEAIKTLRADCLKNPSSGYVEIEYCKRRARHAEWKRLRVRDGGSGTPGGLLRLAIQWTATARGHLGSEQLFTYYCRGRLTDVVLPMQSARKVWVKHHRLQDDDGKPLKLCLSRLRKTHKAAWYRKTGGQLRRFAVGHTVEVAANHYGDIPALRPIHEATIAEALLDAVEDALQPTVLTPEAEANVLAAPSSAQPGFPEGMATDVSALLAGEQDVWLASCSGFYSSPFANSGEACPVPFWGCLECRNGVITTRKLPALMAFLDFVVDQRKVLSEADWQVKFGRVHYRISAQILPQFSKTDLDAARSLAARQPTQIYLPPEAGLA